MDETPILMCYDGSRHSQHAIDAAAKLLGPRKAVVLDLGAPITAAESLAALSPAVPGQAIEELNSEDALARARAGADYARRAGFEAEARAEIGAPTWQGIVTVADELDTPLIVLGSRGLHGAQELFEGSVSHQVAAHARRPVLIVPPTS